MFIPKAPTGREGVQRGSVLDLPLYPGDPLSPGWASEPGSKRLPLSEAQTMMKIPVLPDLLWRTRNRCSPISPAPSLPNPGAALCPSLITSAPVPTERPSERRDGQLDAPAL